MFDWIKLVIKHLQKHNLVNNFLWQKGVFDER